LTEDATIGKYADGETVSNLATSGVFNLFAVWGAKMYSITFDSNGGEGSIPAMMNIPFESDVTLTLNNDSMTKTGYTFLGWSEDATATTPTYLEQLSNIQKLVQWHCMLFGRLIHIR